MAAPPKLAPPSSKPKEAASTFIQVLLYERHTDGVAEYNPKRYTYNNDKNFPLQEGTPVVVPTVFGLNLGKVVAVNVEYKGDFEVKPVIGYVVVE